jgi:periplasmic protein TonB
MSYAHPHAGGRRTTGLIVTVALHIVLIYALIHGLARKIVEVVVPPLETKIIAEVKPPQPDKPPPPPPKLATPPPPFIPPPEINIQIPVQQAPTITAVAPTPPPPAPITPTPAPQAVRTAPVVLASSCDKPEYPPAARRANETGTVLLSFLIDASGRVIQSKVERSSGSRRLDEAAREGLGLCKFRPATVDGVPQQAWARIEYVWRLE